MKKGLSLMSLLCILMLHLTAQENILLQQSFWQTQPSVGQVKAEVEKGADPTELNSRSFDPVVLAINAKAPNETVMYLINQPGNAIDKITHDSRIYLHWAALRGNVALTDFLIKKGSNIKLKDSHGVSPLNFAVGNGLSETKIYDLFLANGENLKTDLNDNGANALLLATTNDKDMVLTKYFVSKGLSILSKDADGINAFGYAAKGGNIENMKALLAMGVPADVRSIALAAHGRNLDNTLPVYKYLESLKIDPKATLPDGANALHNLVKRQKQNEAITYFLEKGVDVNQTDGNGNTVFMNAASANADVELLKTLQPKIKNINQQNKKGESALMLALAYNNAEVVEYLLTTGSDIKVSDLEGNNLNTYLVEAFSRLPKKEVSVKSKALLDYERKIDLLKGKGFERNITAKNGSTLYHLAVVKGNISLLKGLSVLNLDVNAKNGEGYTALHKAALLSKNDEIMKYLISIGAKKDLKTGFDETAFDLANENELLTKNKVALTFLK